MKRFAKLSVFVALAVVAGAITFGGEAKVTICHYPPGNPANYQIITVGASAVPAHFANHGDNYPTIIETDPQNPTIGCAGPGVSAP